MARSVWTGSINFALVNVPVKAFTAVRDHDVHFNQLVDGARVRYRKVSEDTGEEVDDDDIVMGYEVAKGQYVTFERDELDDLRPESTDMIEVEEFVALADIDPIHYQQTYWLAPDGDAAKSPYQLLRAAMEERERVAIGTVVMRNKQHLTAVRPLDGALAMSTMRFADEIVDRADIDELPSRRSKPAKKELELATQLLDALNSDWKPERYHDTYTDELRRRIEAKESGEEIVSEATPEQPDDKVVDLAGALEQSLEEAKQRKQKRQKKAS